MTGTIHKLSAGAGYDYLTRSVCCDDATGLSGKGLASYYSERGDIPGAFVGRGVAGIGGVAAGDRVTADRMKSLFGVGMHPLAIERNQAFDAMPAGQRPSKRERIAATHLGRPYPVLDDAPSAFSIEVARRIHAHNKTVGGHREDAVPERIRAQIRTDVAREFFVAEHGREPDGPRELGAIVAKNSRPRRTTVSGYDLTFSPVKSVSTLWAIASPDVAAQIEAAHNAAVTDALDWLERHALFTREGRQGVRQVDVTGLVATAFVHRDSRAGDPDLHTHVAIANKVQTLSGRWLSIDGRVLYKATVSVSETYNTALEKRLGELLGVRFRERPDSDPRKRPVREIEGVDPVLNLRFSKRRIGIEHRRDQLVVAFQHDHGRPPTSVEAIALAQQATLETRQAKHDPRTLEEQRSTWRAEAIEVLGSDEAITAMVNTALTPISRTMEVVDADWLTQTARSITATLQSQRAVWQQWHVYAEAQRRVRATNLSAGDVAGVVEQLTTMVLTQNSVSLARRVDPVREPEQLRRRDGISVYTTAGSTLFTTTATLAAEQRLVAAAGRFGGMAIPDDTVAIALMECTANGISLNPGQTCLVREMATSGARLQLAIAPAGSGKTTAMRALAAAWSHAGGSVLGLAPSAVAAAELGAQINTGATTTADTLAKLVHAITTGTLPSWAAAIGAKSLLVIDEAGMADTLALDTVVAFALERGASVRLIGDDQQLAAIGAGGVLRDIRATHGALQLSELMRFHNTAEGSASLALREGRPEALGFYLDHDRVHVGDQTSMADAVFNAWARDRAAGLESLMLAPTRELVADLNQRARTHRLATTPPGSHGPSVRLADGNQASVGDVIITRVNDRSLRLAASDWVKNGDRWEILAINAGGLQAQHRGTGRRVFLPSEYITASTDLGYACTVHTAQGVTADTTHGLVTGEESRQQLYTLATRGRDANHLYLTVASDGDPHNLIHPDVINPKTATEMLESILARDGSPKSATTLQREAFEPAARLGEATARYTDALWFACEDVLGADQVQAIEDALEGLHPGISKAAAWPALRAHLVLLAANATDPVSAAAQAAREGELGSAVDPAAVIGWRLAAAGQRSPERGPLPWLPAVPHALHTHDMWGPDLQARSDLVTELGQEVRSEASTRAVAPTWVTSGVRLPPEVIADVEVWRAATSIPREDLRPTGPRASETSAARWQRRLNRQITGPDSPAIKEWGTLLTDLHPGLARDAFTPILADRLAAMTRAGVNPHPLLATAAAAGHLPDDHAAAALWWRISTHITPAVAARMDQGDHLTTSSWLPDLRELIGETDSARLRTSSWWPALLAVVDQGLRRGWALPDLLALESTNNVDERVDLCQALVWRASIALADIPDHHGPAPEESDTAPEDLYDGWEPPPTWSLPSIDTTGVLPAEATESTSPTPEAPGLDRLNRQLLLVAISRDLRVISEEQLATESDLRRAYLRAAEWDRCPLTRERMIDINNLTQEFFEHAYPDSWARPYLKQRFGYDLIAHEQFQPGYAPTGWTNLTDHLRHHGVTEEGMLTTGVATTTRDGRLIDRFRDRVTLPITNPAGEILGFVARRHPLVIDNDRNGGPKYLNTPDTPLFHKGAQLFGVLPDLVDQGAVPVVVEGPMDAIAVTLATAGTHLGVAPLGTALTEDQAIQLARIFQHTSHDPIVATDADTAGHTAARRDFWILAGVGLEPRYAPLPAGADPASLLATRGPAELAGVLRTPQPLASVLIDERLHGSSDAHLQRDLTRLLAASGPAVWDENLVRIAHTLRLSEQDVKRELLAKAKAWDTDPRHAATTVLQEHRPRAAASTVTSTDQQWLQQATSIDPRLATDRSWPLLSQLLKDIHATGYDVPTLLKQVTKDVGLGTRPVQELIDRVAAKVGTIAASQGQTTLDTTPTPRRKLRGNDPSKELSNRTPASRR